MKHGAAVFAVGLVSSLAVGCGGTAPPAATPTAKAAPAEDPPPQPGKQVQIEVKGTEPLVSLLEAVARGDSLKARPPGQFPKRTQVRPVAFQLSSLPFARVPFIPRPPEARGPNRVRPKATDPADDVKLVPHDPKVTTGDRTMQLSLVDPDTGSNDGFLGQIVLADNMARGRAAGQAMMIYERCGPNFTGTNRLVELRWERFRAKKGGAELTVSQGVLDRNECKVYSSFKSKVLPRPIVGGGVLYGFRTCTADPCEANEALSLVFARSLTVASNSLGGDPSEELGTFSVVTLPVKRGGGAAMVATVAGGDLAAWQKTLGRRDPLVTVPITLGLDVSQGVREDDAIAVAYLGTDEKQAEKLRAISQNTPDPSF